MEINGLHFLHRLAIQQIQNGIPRNWLKLCYSSTIYLACVSNGNLEVQWKFGGPLRPKFKNKILLYPNGGETHDAMSWCGVDRGVKADIWPAVDQVMIRFVTIIKSPKIDFRFIIESRMIKFQMLIADKCFKTRCNCAKKIETKHLLTRDNILNFIFEIH